MPKIVADSIDQLISIEMRFAAELPRGVIRPLYEAARDVQGGEPLVYQAARTLLEHVFAAPYRPHSDRLRQSIWPAQR